jgi:hypothetical protein
MTDATLGLARCIGASCDGEWREGCEDCQRRDDPETSKHVHWIAPPEIVVFECESRIPPDA